MNSYFNVAYIQVVEEYALNSHYTFDWIRNSPYNNQLAYFDVYGNNGYWTVCVGWDSEEVARLEEFCGATCNHKMIKGDDDPEHEGIPSLPNSLQGCDYSFVGYAEDIPGNINVD